MFEHTKAFSGFSVDDTERARSFYGDTLGVRVSDAGEDGVLVLEIAGDRPTIVYPKADHQPATFTVLNFPVDDIEAAVDALAARGVQFQHYDDPPTDGKGIMRGFGPLIAWFPDPAGNVFSVIAQD